jgi:hypothetical protein
MNVSIKSLIREPLLHFLLLGAVLFFYFDLVSGESGEAVAPKRIIVSSGQVEQLAANFARTWSRPPTEQELDTMVESQVREEVFYREALAMGLDQNDPMVRRRLRMKLEFMLEDLSGQDASDEVLSDFLGQNPDRFRDEARITFHQVYLSPALRPDLEKDAQELLSRLNDGEDPETLGDRTLVTRSFQLAPQGEVGRDFGDEFARQIVLLPVGEWGGPVYSPFGAHLVHIEARIDARLPDLAEIRDEVLRKYLAEKREQQKNLAYEKLREGYEVTVEPLNSRPMTVVSSAVAGETR